MDSQPGSPAHVDGLHRYGYGGGEPVGTVDRSGHDLVALGTTVVAIGVAAAIAVEGYAHYNKRSLVGGAPACAGVKPLKPGHVEFCTRKADLPAGPLGNLGDPPPNSAPPGAGMVYNAEHWFLRTSTKTAGIGPDFSPQAGGPGCGGGVMGGTSIQDHGPPGDPAPSNATCKLMPEVDEECVNGKLEIGRQQGLWFPGSLTCQTFVEDVLSACSCVVGLPEIPWDNYSTPP